MPRKKHSRLQFTLWRHVIPRLRLLNYWIIARFAMLTLWTLRRLPADKALNFAAYVARRVGPWFGRHRTAIDNLRLAFPDKTGDEIEAIALDMWENMAKLAAEYIFLDQLFDFNPDSRQSGRIEIVGEERFLKIAAEKRPHILFTAHIGNFELLPIAGAVHGMELTALFRPPNNPYIADYILSTRRSTMGELLASSNGAAFALAATLEKGGNVGVLVDQKFSRGLVTEFFGRTCETNPIVPMLARRFECDVYPTRCTRLPGNRYRLEIEDRLELPRDPDGDIDVQASTQLLNDVVERWIREDPGQWMWFHKRWILSNRQRKGSRKRVVATPAGGQAKG